MERYHAMFRVTTDKENTNSKQFGDRDLACFIGNEGEYAFATYRYTDLEGNGDSNSV
jgi:hypothetical protein